ncbi:MAG TPA: cell division protein FtsZ, partial [Methanomethylovorans sp.]|nr:cell division protein FtsZ [Methanomethylovorans sp.]
MQSIVQEALKHTEKDREYRKTVAVDDQLDGFGMPRITIVGCGGAGNNTV